MRLAAIPQLANHLCAISTKIRIQNTFNKIHIKTSLPTIIKQISKLKFCPQSHTHIKNLLTFLKNIDQFQNTTNIQLPRYPYQRQPCKSLTPPTDYIPPSQPAIFSNTSFPDSLEQQQPQPFPPK